jgi:hypothetical protein
MRSPRCPPTTIIYSQIIFNFYLATIQYLLFNILFPLAQVNRISHSFLSAMLIIVCLIILFCVTWFHHDYYRSLIQASILCPASSTVYYIPLSTLLYIILYCIVLLYYILYCVLYFPSFVSFLQYMFRKVCYKPITCSYMLCLCIC